MGATETNNHLKTCKGCGTAGDGKFCRECGESLSSHRLTVGHMLHEVMHHFTHFEKGLGYTVKQLILKPGHMQKDYIAGRRSIYQKPFSMFFVCGTVTALALYWISRAVRILHADADDQEDHFYQHYFTLLQMALVPLYSLVAYLSFFRRYNYAEYLVILLYNTSILFLFVSLANLTKLPFGAYETGYLEVVFVLLYNVITYLNIFDDKPRWSVILRTLISSIICFALSRLAMEAFISFAMPHK